jgi:hypothetical protein
MARESPVLLAAIALEAIDRSQKKLKTRAIMVFVARFRFGDGLMA